MIYWIIVLIYGSFILDLCFWRLPSEAGTFRLMNDKHITVKKKVIFFGAYLLAVVFYVCPLIMAVWALIYMPKVMPDTIDYIGLALAIFGRIFTLSGARSLYKFSTADLMTKSMFKWSRNPIVLGLHLTILGMLLIFSHWLLWVGFVIYAVNIHHKIIMEEYHLKNKYGELYAAYKQKTPRYLII